MPIDLTCSTCGLPFTVPPSQSHQRFCSIACRRIPPKHGGVGTKLYRIWHGMNARCRRQGDRIAKHYGDRGIAVCAEWQASFVAFRDWALSHGYEDGLEIDRRDTNAGYCPENCRWATRTQNNRNTLKKRPAESTSQFKGVFFDRDAGRYRAQIRDSDGKSKYLGLFHDEEAAAHAYDLAASQIQGEFARLNFPIEGGVPSHT